VVTADRRLRLLGLLTDGTGEIATSSLCALSARVTGMSGAGIMLMAGDVAQGSLCASNDVASLIEDLQFQLGEGPCVDACREARPVLESDLVHPDPPRWMAFSTPAVDAGVRAVFGFPLHLGEVRLGALNLYRDRRGPMSDEQHGDALVMADIVVRAVLAMQANASPGQLAAELETSADFQYVVHQASGMVAVQLGVSVAQALIRLRAHAFSNDEPLARVAEDVVDRRLRFDASDTDPG
jgi:GAF domain-containing protein